ncbi:hypothetical protein CSW10_01945 [Mesomycoplasma dispar]|uniref:Uncharacterized protein n=1 Tax=Mesomycoplasma dispar TaxID=86660 RepID=A0ABN5E012_9BACT|nr:hypothetical protein CSW10_01945 [Mesomycoplasma dispar]
MKSFIILQQNIKKTYFFTFIFLKWKILFFSDATVKKWFFFFLQNMFFSTNLNKIIRKENLQNIKN